MINTVSQSVANEVTSLFDYADFELMLYHSEANEDVINRLNSLPGIESTYGYYQVNEIKIKEKNDYVQNVWGVDADEYFQYWQFPLEDKETVIEQFGKGRNAIIGHVMQQKFDLEVGDTITLQFKNKSVAYKVSGITTSLMQNGDFILIPETYLREDTDVYYYSEIMIRTNQVPADVVSLIDEAFDNELYEVHVLKDIFDKNIESNNQLFGLLTGFSIITMVIGVFGILNNFIVSFISRKRSLAIYRSIGMSKKQLFKMLLIESFICGLIGGFTGLLGGILFINNAEVVTYAMSLPIEMFPSLKYMIIAIVSGVVVSTLASISPVLKYSKHSIVESIKYE
jgi:putative ABC transport system permease protein